MPPAAPNSPLLITHDYEGLRALRNNRRIELRMSMLEVDELAGFPGGYASKLFAAPREGDYNRSIGPKSMGKLLRALGLGISLVHSRVCEESSEGKPSCPQLSRMAQLWRMGGCAKHKMTPAERREWHRKGGIASAKKRRALAKARKRREADMCARPHVSPVAEVPVLMPAYDPAKEAALESDWADLPRAADIRYRRA